jgi:hypothetical protein
MSKRVPNYLATVIITSDDEHFELMCSHAEEIMRLGVSCPMSVFMTNQRVRGFCICSGQFKEIKNLSECPTELKIMHEQRKTSASS